MTRPILPPRGIFVPTKLLEAPIRAPVLATAVKILALTWGRSGDTPELSWKFLEEYTGLHRSQLYGHLSHLASMGVCAWMSRRGGYLIVRFMPGFYPKSNGVLDEESEISDALIGGGLINTWVYESPPPNDQVLNPKTVRKNGQSSEILDDIDELPPHIRDRLTEINIFPELFGEIARAGWEEEQLLKLADDVEQESSTPGGLFMFRLRTQPPPMTEAQARQRYAEE